MCSVVNFELTISLLPVTVGIANDDISSRTVTTFATYSIVRFS
jgi:hypothetical protein